MSTVNIKLYTVSDLHIDWNQTSQQEYHDMFKDIERDSSYLIIAGDLCEVRNEYELFQFFDTVTLLFKKIFYVPGNHEYYKIYLDDNYIRQLVKKYDNVVFLQNDFYEDEDDKFVIYGTTLWTESSGDLMIDQHVASVMMDYKLIYNKQPDISRPPFGTYKIPVTRSDMIDLHKYMFNKLEEFLGDIKEETKTKIIVTHHLPTYDLISDEYTGDATNSGYASQLDDKLRKLDFDYWVCGHTHKSKDYDFKLDSGKVAKFIVNPKGYDRENLLFDPTKNISL